MMMMRVAGVETGGEHIVVAVAEEGNKIVSRWECPTTTDSTETIAKIAAHLTAEHLRSPLSAVGIAAFGPIDPDIHSPKYGHVTTTPKPGWRMTDLVGPLRAALLPAAVPFGFDTDVNAAALAELSTRRSRGCDVSSLAYITVGTGVGVGLVCDGRPVHGMLHPEGGHMRTRRAPGDETFPGTCPFHGDCIEGMIASGALSKRLGIAREMLPSVADDHPVWKTIAFYLAELCASLVLMVSPGVIVLGGGIMKRKCLFPMVRSMLVDALNGYIQMPQLAHSCDGEEKGIENFVVPASFGSDTGVMGAIELARHALTQQQ